MNNELRQQIIEALRRGENLPDDVARELLAPEKREYELVYRAKRRTEDVIADALAVPLQSVSTFGADGADWQNMLILGDNLQVLKRLLEDKKAGKLCNADGTPGVRLVYIDPPFATQQEFHGTQDQKAYRDKVLGAEFVEFLRQRFILLHELLATDGSLFLHADYRKVHYLKVILDEIFDEPNFRNEIILPAWAGVQELAAAVRADHAPERTTRHAPMVQRERAGAFLEAVGRETQSGQSRGALAPLLEHRRSAFYAL